MGIGEIVRNVPFGLTVAELGFPMALCSEFPLMVSDLFPKSTYMMYTYFPVGAESLEGREAQAEIPRT